MDHEGMDLLRDPAGEGAVERWLDYLDRTRVSLHYPSSLLAPL